MAGLAGPESATHAATDGGTGAPPQFHVVGDAMVDVLAGGMASIPAWGGDAGAASIGIQAGGSALNTAAHLASLLGTAGTVFFHGCVGDDDFASKIRSCLERAGVRPNLSVLPGTSTGSCIVLSGASDRAFVTCAGATAAMSAAHLSEIGEHVRRATGPVHVHFGGFYSYGPLRWEIPALVRALRQEAAARKVGLGVSLDIQGSEPSQLEGLPEALGVLDVLKANEFELEAAILAMGLPAEEPLRALAGLSRSVVVTQGGRGALYYGLGNAGHEEGHVPARKVQVLDSTGAGDACSAGLLAALGAGAGLRAAVELGCAAGAVACTRLGGCALPVTGEDVRTLERGDT